MNRRGFFRVALSALMGMIAAAWFGFEPAKKKLRKVERWNAKAKAWEQIRMIEARAGDFIRTDDDLPGEMWQVIEDAKPHPTGIAVATVEGPHKVPV